MINTICSPSTGVVCGFSINSEILQVLQAPKCIPMMCVAIHKQIIHVHRISFSSDIDFHLAATRYLLRTVGKSKPNCAFQQKNEEGYKRDPHALLLCSFMVHSNTLIEYLVFSDDFTIGF